MIVDTIVIERPIKDSYGINFNSLLGLYILCVCDNEPTYNLACKDSIFFSYTQIILVKKCRM